MAEQARLTPEQRWTLILTALASFMISLDALVVATALPTIRADLHASVAGLGWTVNAFTLGFAVCVLTGAALGDRFGRRRIFITGLTLFTVASAVCALSPTIGTLIAARAIQGIGGGLAIPLALVILNVSFPPARRGMAIGIWGAISGVAVASGPLVGGAIVQGLTWQWIFWLNVPIGIAVCLLSRSQIRESVGPPRRLDLPGLVLATAAICGLADGLIRGNEVGWTSVEAIGAFAIGVIGLLAFLGWEWRSATPMLPLGLFRNASFSASCTAGFMLYVGLYGCTFLIAQYLQFVLGNGPLGVGVRLLPWTGGVIVLAPIAGRLADRIGERPFVVVGLLLNAVGFLMIALRVTEGSGYGALFPALLIPGCGVAIAIPTVSSAVLRSVAREQAGIASGTFITLRQIGGVFGVAVVAWLFTSKGGYDTPAHFVAGLRTAMVAVAALSLVGAVVALAIRTRPVAPVTAPASVETELVGAVEG